MRRSYFEIYIHIIWATKNREDLINEKIEAQVKKVILEKCTKFNIKIIARENTKNHVHLLISILPDTNISVLVKEIKGASSHFVNNKMNETLYWQDGFGALSISKSGLSKVKQYIENQKHIHESRENIVTIFEKYCKENE